MNLIGYIRTHHTATAAAGIASLSSIAIIGLMVHTDATIAPYVVVLLVWAVACTALASSLLTHARIREAQRNNPLYILEAGPQNVARPRTAADEYCADDLWNPVRELTNRLKAAQGHREQRVIELERTVKTLEDGNASLWQEIRRQREHLRLSQSKLMDMAVGKNVIEGPIGFLEEMLASVHMRLFDLRSSTLAGTHRHQELTLALSDVTDARQLLEQSAAPVAEDAPST